MQSPDGNQLWCPGQTLWSLIAEHVSASELPKIHAALGYPLVNMCKDVHTEAEMLHKMWQESQHGNNNSRTGIPPNPCHQVSLLADPPAVKELVRAEVKMLLQTLRERASREGRDEEELLFRYKPETVDYAMSHLDSCYRISSNPGDTDNGSRPSSHCSVQSSAEDEIEAIRDKLNVTDIDQVVVRLRSVLMEECESLNMLVNHFKRNLKQKCLGHEINKSEPTLAELKELRGAIQMDLELYPSSSASSPFPLKDLKQRFRMSAGQKVSNETLQALSTTSALRPHPPPLSHPIPRPPPGPPPSKTYESTKPINGSPLSSTPRQHRSVAASNGPKKTQIAIHNRVATSGHVGFSTTSDSDKMMVKPSHPCSRPSDQHSDGLHCITPTSTPSFKINTPRNSPIHETHRPSHHGIHSPSTTCEMLQMERTSSWNSTDLSTSTGKSKSSTCGGSLVSAALPTDHDRTKTCQIKSGSCSAQTDGRKSDIRNDRHGKNAIQLLDPETAEMHSTLTEAMVFTSHTKTLDDTKSSQKGVQESQMKLEPFGNFLQAVPPARVSS